MGWVPEFSVRGRDSKGLARWSMKGKRQGCVAGGSRACSFHRGDPRGHPWLSRAVLCAERSKLPY